MRAKRLFCIVLSLILCLTLCTPALAEGDLLFVAVNDSIPLTLTALPYESSSGIYVPYTAFDASPGGVIPAYNAQAQTFVLFTRQRRLVFDLAEGTVTDQDGNVKTVSTTFRGGMLYVPLEMCIRDRPMDEVYAAEYKKLLAGVIANKELPIVCNLNIGHALPRCILPFGVRARVDAGEQVIRFG